MKPDEIKQLKELLKIEHFEEEQINETTKNDFN